MKTADDFISRQSAIDALAKHEKSRGHNYSFFVDVVSECAEVVRDLPSAQPEPEIIRCKDCKHLGKRGLCEIWDYYISNEDFYCGCARRRTDSNGRD